MSTHSRVSLVRGLSIVLLLVTLLASAAGSVSAQDSPDGNNPAAQPDKISTGAKPGVYYIDYLGDADQLSPSIFPVDGGLGFWSWSTLNPADGAYDWDAAGAKQLDNWIQNRADAGLGTGIMISTYDATNSNDIRSTPNWVIKLPDAVIPATNAADGSPNYIDYFRRTSKKTLNGRFDDGLNLWTVNNGYVITVVPSAPTDPEGIAAGPALQLGGQTDRSASAIHDSEAVPAMPSSLSGKLNVSVTARVNIATTDPNPNDFLYMWLLDAANNKLAELRIDNRSHAGQAANYWKTYTLDVSSVGTEKPVKVAFAVSNDAANPTTFYVDNVSLNVRHLIPKYWGDSYKGAYKKFIAALGSRYKTTPSGGNPKYDLQFIAMGTGTYGESQPTQDQPVNYDHDMKAAGLTTSKQWSDWVNEISATYASAFSTGGSGAPARALLLQYAPSYLSGEERGITTDYAANLGVGLSHNRLTPEFTSLFRYGTDRAGFYDPLYLHGSDVPVAMEAYYDDIGCSPVLTYWSVLNAVDKHTDFLRVDPRLIRASTSVPTSSAAFFDWAQNYLGKSVQTTPNVWTVMREHRNPAITTCGASYYVDTTSGSPYPQYGNYNYWLYQVDTIAGGKTVAETNDKGADRRYAKIPNTTTAAPQAGLGNCPTKSYSTIFASNPPTCNPEPYNPNLPALAGQTDADLYDPAQWSGDGKEAWMVRRTDQATDNPFMFFRIDDGYMKGDATHVYSAKITVGYFDIGTDKFSIKYDSATGEKIAGTVTKTGSKQYKTVTFTVDDAKFANRLTGSSDFYLDSRDPSTNAKDGNEWLHIVQVEKLAASQAKVYLPLLQK